MKHPLPLVLTAERIPLALPWRSLRLGGTSLALFALLLSISASAQTPYPPAYIRNVDWTTGMRFITVPQPIIAPGYELEPTTITGTTHTEFISATEVRLTPGFHAGGFSGEGRFRAWIHEGLGDPSDVIVITPEDAVNGSDNMVHVPKWEKLEVGLKLPEDFADAVASFYANYYPYPGEPNTPSNPNEFTSNPNNTDASHDLNPYADDSLQVFLMLTNPLGQQRIKHGFYMKEAKWVPNATSGDQLLADDTDHPLDPYRIRFRFAPDMEGTWQFWLGLRAPNTLNANDAPLVPLTYVGYGFMCDPPLPDKHGPLHVNQANRRILQHADGTPFLGLGTNLPDVLHTEGTFGGDWGTFYQRDMEIWKETMDKLHSVGGNFLRMWLYKNILSPEWGNLGVYDAYRLHGSCNGQGLTGEVGNCQFQCWSFDQLLDHAELNNIYLQLCVDPSYPSGWGSYLWGKHPYVSSFLEPERDPTTGLLDSRHYFYKFIPPDPDIGVPQLNEGVFYYWKRRYKYIMSRWGYSPHLAMLEPFNETDQMLGYKRQDLTQETDDGNVCPEDRLVWEINDGLPETISNWLTDLTDFVRGAQNTSEPWRSPLGESKLFVMSYTDYIDTDLMDYGDWSISSDDVLRPNYYAPFENERVDLIDVHKGLHPMAEDMDDPDRGMKVGFDHAGRFWNALLPSNTPRKPFNHGEYCHYTDLAAVPGGPLLQTDKIFHNYDVSFHNELWSSAFSGKFAAGTTWHQERVFWWEDGVKRPPADEENDFQQNFSNALGVPNELDIGLPDPVVVTNRPIHHHFRPLADLLALLEMQPEPLLTGYYEPHKIHDLDDQVECYYLTNGITTVGWVHNLNAWTMNNFYLASSTQNFLGCNPPALAPQEIVISGLSGGHYFHIYWFPTRLNTEECPADQEDFDFNTSVTLRLDDPASAAFGGVANNYLDTLHTDYAFIITPAPLVKSLSLPDTEQPPPVVDEWDFILYPNPTRGELFLKLTDDTPYSVALHDPSGRTIKTWSGTNGPLIHLPIEELAQGIYWVRVSDGQRTKAKKLVIY